MHVHACVCMCVVLSTCQPQNMFLALGSNLFENNAHIQGVVKKSLKKKFKKF